MAWPCAILDSSHSGSRPKQTSGPASGRKAFSRDVFDHVCKIKRCAKTDEAYRFKARMIVRGFEMEKGVDFIDNFSPTPGLAVARLMMSIAIANGMELHKVDIEQAFLQADKLDEGVNGRYFINPPPGSPEAGNKDVVYEVMKPPIKLKNAIISRVKIMASLDIAERRLPQDGRIKLKMGRGAVIPLNASSSSLILPTQSPNGSPAAIASFSSAS